MSDFNPYLHLLDDQSDKAEHDAECRAGMAIPYKRHAPAGSDKWWNEAKAIDDHRRARAALQAALAAEALGGAA